MLSEPVIHPRSAAILRRLARMGPPAQPLLITGPVGMGKGYLARWLARAWNCTATQKPCGECDRCRAVETGGGEQFTTLDGAVGSVAALSALKARARFIPTVGTHVVLLEGANAATPPALSSLLKILEDPPNATTFILTAPHPDALPSTLVSRCLSFPLPRLDETTARVMLNPLGVPRARQAALLRMAQGRPGRLVFLATHREEAAATEESDTALSRQLLQALPDALAAIPAGGYDAAQTLRVLSNLLYRVVGLPAWALSSPVPVGTLTSRAVASAASELLTDVAAARFSARASAERVVLALHS